ncbi:MAG: amino acid racemase [Clostridiales bacterium]|nr:amino acid racemase [Clostridiales bacterium]
MNKLGIIGGLGPMATIYFMELVVKMTKADVDSDHIPMIVYSYPETPDRTAYLLDHSKPNPLPVILKMAKELEEQKVDFIAMPCITAHYFGNEIHQSLKSAKFINMIEETAKYLHSIGATKIGLMATDGTVKSKVFEKTLNDYDIEVVVPSIESQKKVMRIIYDEVKAGKPVSITDLYDVKNELKDLGAKVCILGCTELSVVKGSYKLDNDFVDVLDILAMKSVELCGGTLLETPC